MYSNRIRCGVWRGTGPFSHRRSWGGTPVWFSAVVAVVLLVTAGVAYRAAAVRLYGDALTPVKLPAPLEQVPRRIGGWLGEDRPIEENIVAYMKQNFADDYVSRHYVNAKEGVWANLYVVYCSSRPGGILGHEPTKCFPGNGWTRDGTETSRFVSSSGRPIDCLVHRFHKSAPVYQQIVVLTFYVLNGQITLNERDFSGVLGRLPNLSGDPARYVAQVQVSSTLEYSARIAAAEMADTLLAFLPGPKDPAHPTSGGN